jgi:hypothetical protein
VRKASTLLVELLGHLRDPRFRDPLDPELRYEPFDAPRGHAADVALGDHLHEGALGTPAWLQQPLREVGAFPELGDAQRDRAGSRVPGTLAIAVSPIHPLSRALTVVRATKRIDVGSHQLPGEDLHHLPQQVDVGSFKLLAEVLQGINPVLDHRAPPLGDPHRSR